MSPPLNYTFANFHLIICWQLFLLLQPKHNRKSVSNNKNQPHPALCAVWRHSVWTFECSSSKSKQQSCNEKARAVAGMGVYRDDGPGSSNKERFPRSPPKKFVVQTIRQTSSRRPVLYLSRVNDWSVSVCCELAFKVKVSDVTMRTRPLHSQHFHVLDLAYWTLWRHNERCVVVSGLRWGRCKIFHQFDLLFY